MIDLEFCFQWQKSLKRENQEGFGSFSKELKALPSSLGDKEQGCFFTQFNRGQTTESYGPLLCG